MRAILFCCFLFFFTCINAQSNKTEKEITVVYLGHSGWAIKTNKKLLIFDYQERYDFNWEVQPQKSFASGYIKADEIKDYDVYVFASHEHSDHFDPVILEWKKELNNIAYFFGWDYSKTEDFHCLKDTRTVYKDDKIEVFTINSQHSGVFESAFLVKIDGISIYHNGDYKGSFKNDYNYLKTKTDKIDIAFSNSDPYPGSQYLEQSELLINDFNVKYFFPMHSLNKEKSYKKFAKMLKENGVQASIKCAEIKGDNFKLNIN